MRILTLSLFVFVIALAVGALTVTRLIPNPPKHKIASSQTPSVLGKPSSNVKLEKYEIVINNQQLSATLITGVDLNSTSLVLNLDDPRTANNIFDEGTCTAVVNDGVYTTQDTPIGYFLSDYKIQKQEINSDLFDGFVSINDFGTPRITRNIPRDNLRSALQSGPMLIENDKILDLAIRNDQPARRMAVATTGANGMVFVAIYDDESKFIGPYLADMPEVLRKLEVQTEIHFADAINLDGGTASAMYTKEFKLPEASLIGSYYCIN